MMGKIDGKTFLFLALFVFFWLTGEPLSAGQSTIVTAEGYSCMGVDKSRRETEKEARAEAKRNALENALTHIKSATHIKDFQVEKDLIEAYARGKVTILEEMQDRTGWYRDATMGDCFRYAIKVEVTPDENTLVKAKEQPSFINDPTAPLHVQIWTEKKEYREGETIKILFQGNRPFYARILYKDAAGNIVQILPNPYRRDNYFQGGIVYEIPEGNRDRFQLEVTPPFGQEELILHASSLPLGDLEVEARGSVYQVKTAEKDIGTKSRGIKITSDPGTGKGKAGGAEFFETKLSLSTRK